MRDSLAVSLLLAALGAQPAQACVAYPPFPDRAPLVGDRWHYTTSLDADESGDCVLEVVDEVETEGGTSFSTRETVFLDGSPHSTREVTWHVAVGRPAKHGDARMLPWPAEGDASRRWKVPGVFGTFFGRVVHYKIRVELAHVGREALTPIEEAGATYELTVRDFYFRSTYATRRGYVRFPREETRTLWYDDALGLVAFEWRDNLWLLESAVIGGVPQRP